MARVYLGPNGTCIQETGSQQFVGAAGVFVQQTAGLIRVWNGTTWVKKQMKVWNGSTWVVKPVKYWNGTNWVLT